MKKVNNIIQLVKKSYELYAPMFHEHFSQEFDRSLVSNCVSSDTPLFGGSGVEYSNALSYNHDKFDKFVDRCVFYRLGITDVKPLLKDIVYDLSSTLSPTSYEQPIEDIFAKIVYCAFPARLTSKLQKQLEAHNIDAKIIDFIISKIEVNIE